MDTLEALGLSEEQLAAVQQAVEAVKTDVNQTWEEQTKGLKANNDKLLAEKRQKQREAEEAQTQAKQQAEEKARAENDYKQLFEAQKTEADVLRNQIEQMNSQAVQARIDSESGKIANGLTKDTAKAVLLQQQISQRLSIVDDEIRVTDNGQLTVSTLDDLTSTIKERFPFLVDGSQAAGGGAARSEGRAKERSTEISRADFDSMTHSQRAEFFASGGQLFDD